MKEDLNTINNIIHASTFERSHDSYSGSTEGHRIRSEVESTKRRNDFYRYLSWKIQSSPLEKRVKHRYTNFYISVFTQLWDLIKGLYRMQLECLTNKSHLTEATIIQNTLQTLEEWWDYDYEDYVWKQENINNV